MQTPKNKEKLSSWKEIHPNHVLQRLWKGYSSKRYYERPKEKKTSSEKINQKEREKMIRIEKRLHAGFVEFENARLNKTKIPQYFGKWQYIYRHKKFEISLVKLKDIFHKCWFWEIYCLKGDLFEDVERFPTKKKAEERIEGILGIWT